MEDIIDIIVTETTNLIEITSQPTDEVIDVNIIDNREDITLNVTPSVVEININQLTGNFGILWGEIEGTLSNQTDLQNALNLKADLVDGKVPSSQLPSYVDDIVEVATYSALPAIGETGKIYVVLDTNLIYRWSGSAYIEIKDSSAVWGAITGTLSNQTDLQNALNAKANDSEVVKLAGVQTITGIKVYNAIQRFNFGISVESVGGANQGIFGNDNGFNLGVNAYTHSILFPNSGGYNFTFPATSGTIALTSDLHNAVTLGTANGLSLSTQILSLGLASSSANGALSSTDWTTFNSKQAALSGTGFVKISGTTISYDNSTYLTTSAAASTYLALSGGTLTGAVTGTRLVLVQNSADIALSIVQTGAGRGLSVLGTSYFSSDISFGSLSNGILKANTLGGLVLATAGTDYQAPLSGTGFVKSTGGTISYDTSTYALDSAVVKLTGDQNIDGNKEFILPTTFRLGIGLKNPDGIYNYISSINSGWKINTNNKEHQLLFSTSTAYTYTFPSATGTIALTSNLSSYLPLAGGTLTGALNGTSALFSGAVRANNPSEGATGEGLIAGQSFKIDGTGTSQKAVMYMVSNVLSDTYASGLTAQFANFAGDKGFGFNLNTSGGYELYVKNTTWNKALTIANTGAATFASSVSATQLFASTSSNVVGGINSSDANGGYLTWSTNGTVIADIGTANQIFGSGGAETFGINGRGSRAIAFGANNTERMRITSAGNVGIGTTSPGAALDVVSAIRATNSATSGYSSSQLQLFAYNGSSVAYGGGIFHTSNSFAYQQIATNQTNIYGVGANGIRIATANAPIIFNTGNSDADFSAERMRITSGGFLKATTTGSYITSAGSYHELTSNQNNPTLYLLNHDGAGEGLLVNLNTNGTTYNFFRGYSNSAGANRIIIYSNGNVVNANNSYGAISDIKLKENISDSTPKLADLLKVKVKNFNFIGSEDKQLGVIAQELEEVFPSMIDISPDRDVDGNDLGTVTKSVKYSVFVPMLIKAVQELSDKIKTLENK